MTTLVPAGPLYVVNGPPPRRRPFDLLSASLDITPAGTHWMAGTQVYPYPTDLPGVHNPCSGGSYGLKDDGEAPPLPQFGGFTAYLPISCTTRGMGGWEEFKGRADMAFEAKQSYSAELELAFDYAGLGNPHLTQGGITPLGGGAVSSMEGLALLEDAIAEQTGVQGVIHASPATVVAWSKEFLVFHEGGELHTVNGTRVVSGAAYAGSRFHPSDEAAPASDQAWAFATGDVAYMLGPIDPLPVDVKEAVDRELNIVTYRTERNMVVVWDTALLEEVLIDRGV